MSRLRYLSVTEVLEIHRRVIATSGGAPGIRELPRLLAAVAQPSSTFDGNDLYQDLAAKGAALCHSLVQGHPFVDGNKRVGHAALEVFLLLNGLELSASVDVQEDFFLRLAAGSVTRPELEVWIRANAVER